MNIELTGKVALLQEAAAGSGVPLRANSLHMKQHCGYSVFQQQGRCRGDRHRFKPISRTWDKLIPW